MHVPRGGRGFGNNVRRPPRDAIDGWLTATRGIETSASETADSRWPRAIYSTKEFPQGIDVWHVIPANPLWYVATSDGRESLADNEYLDWCDLRLHSNRNTTTKVISCCKHCFKLHEGLHTCAMHWFPSMLKTKNCMQLRNIDYCYTNQSEFGNQQIVYIADSSTAEYWSIGPQLPKKSTIIKELCEKRPKSRHSRSI